MNYRSGDDAGVNFFVAQQYCARNLLGCTERVFRHHGKAIDVRAIERRHVDGRHDVGGQNPAERRVERDYFTVPWRAVNRGAETALRFIAVEYLKELDLITQFDHP